MRGMDDPTDDDIFLDAVENVVLEVLDRIGDNPKARFEFFRRLLAVAMLDIESLKVVARGKR